MTIYTEIRFTLAVSYLFVTILMRTNVSWKMRIAPPNEHSARWCFSNYPTSRNSLVLQLWLEVIKKKTDGGGLIHRLYFLILSQQPGLIWYCSQSWEQIFSLIKNQYPLFFFFLSTLLILLPFSSSAATFCCSSSLRGPISLFTILKTGQQRNLHTPHWKLSLCSVISVPPTLRRSWPFLSSPWVMGSGPSSPVTCRLLQPSF